MFTSEKNHVEVVQGRFASQYSSQPIVLGLDRPWPFPVVRLTGKDTSQLVWCLCSFFVVALLVAGAIVTLLEYHETLEERTDRIRKDLIQGCGDWALRVTPQKDIETWCGPKQP
jgi:hypothetical protein